jgi:hypothetical protein
MRSPEQLVANAKEDLAAIEGTGRQDETGHDVQARHIRIFFDALIDLAAQQNEPGVEQLIASFVADTASVLANHEEALGSWLMKMHGYSLRGREEGFLIACQGRSGYAIARELYSGSIVEPVLAELDIADLDETLARMAPEYGVTQIPAGIPPTHTWWLFR